MRGGVARGKIAAVQFLGWMEAGAGRGRWVILAPSGKAFWSSMARGVLRGAILEGGRAAKCGNGDGAE